MAPCKRKRKPACQRSKKVCKAKKKAPKRKTPCCRHRCQRTGPIMNNGFLNFLRAFRRKNCGLSPQEIFQAGAVAWKMLSKCEKERYRRQACKLPKCRRKCKS